MNYECSDEGTCTQNINSSSTRSHPSEEETRTRNRSKNCKCKQAFVTVADNTFAHLKNSAHICITLQFLSVSYVDFRKILRLCLNN